MIKEKPSPNFDEREGNVKPDMIILHYTGMKTSEEALERLCDPQPPEGTGRVSAHYTIDRDGSVFQHVDEAKRAWHAGDSYWDGRKNLNNYSIGIELVNPGHEYGYTSFPLPQIDALKLLMQGIYKRWDIDKRYVRGHQEVAPDRKQDPGELFPWRFLSQRGLCSWYKGEDPQPLAVHKMPDEARQREALTSLGYNPNAHLAHCIRAFQSRYCAANDGRLSEQGAAILEKLLVYRG